MEVRHGHGAISVRIVALGEPDLDGWALSLSRPAPKVAEKVSLPGRMLDLARPADMAKYRFALIRICNCAPGVGGGREVVVEGGADDTARLVEGSLEGRHRAVRLVQSHRRDAARGPPVTTLPWVDVSTNVVFANAGVTSGGLLLVGDRTNWVWEPTGFQSWLDRCLGGVDEPAISGDQYSPVGELVPFDATLPAYQFAGYWCFCEMLKTVFWKMGYGSNRTS